MMVTQYGNPVVIYSTRCDLDQAEAMFQKAEELFQDAGATSEVEHVQQLLQGLHKWDGNEQPRGQALFPKRVVQFTRPR